MRETKKNKKTTHKQPFANGSTNDWLQLIGVGIFAFIAQVLWNAGVQKEKAGIASVIRTFDVVFVLFWSVTVLKERLPALSYIGASLIVLSSVVILIHKMVDNKRKKELKLLDDHEGKDDTNDTLNKIITSVGDNHSSVHEYHKLDD